MEPIDWRYEDATRQSELDRWARAESHSPTTEADLLRSAIRDAADTRSRRLARLAAIAAWRVVCWRFTFWND